MAEIQFIGTGDAFGSGGRRNTAILVRDRGRTLLLDCGPTTLMGLKQLGVDPREIDAIALSHFHGDHVAGVPFLLIDYLFEDRRHTPLEILGPPGVQGRIEKTTRLFHYSNLAPTGYELAFREFTMHQALELPGFSITPLPARHQPDTRPHMLRVRTEDRTLVFTGDTGWHDDLPRHVGSADLLISECVFMQRNFEFHLNHERLHSERERFDCGRIILTHLGAEVLDALDRVEFDTATDGLEIGL
ncbi:MAG: MBL fold metallo-hydrolase [Deltaproteobacteria bacterium]|nr:MBL fold metallo-hydrolase [Deltaproteobacteria bacterium]